MRAIDLINPAGEIAKECQNMLLGTTEKKERWKTIQKKHSNRLETNKTLQHEQPIKLTKIQRSRRLY